MLGIVVSPLDTIMNKTEFAALKSLSPLLDFLKFLYETTGHAVLKLNFYMFVSTSRYFQKIEWFLIHDPLCLAWSNVPSECLDGRKVDGTMDDGWMDGWRNGWVCIVNYLRSVFHVSVTLKDVPLLFS